ASFANSYNACSLMLRLLLLGLLPATFLQAITPVPFHFEPNRGQAPKRVQYVGRVRNAAVFLTDAGLEIESRSGIGVLALDGASPASHWLPAEEAAATTTYYLGRIAHPQMREVPHFTRIVRRDLYPGIDMVAYGAEGRLEYDFVIAPGADPRRIRLR